MKGDTLLENKHWEYIHNIDNITFDQFEKNNVPIKLDKNIVAPNTGVIIENEKTQRSYGIYDPEIKAIRKLKGKIAPNKDLQLLYDAFENKNITIIAVDGLPGTGKTSTVVEEAIKNWINKEKKVYIVKPYVFSESYGFLPGDIDEKTDPTLQNFIQWFERYSKKQFKGNGAYEYYKNQDWLKVLPLAFARGIDIENAFVIVDESQNTTELLTMATRKARASTFCFIGDTSFFQMDNKKCSPEKNGLKDLIDLLSGSPYFQHIELKTIDHILRGEEVKDIIKKFLKKRELSEL
jgi:predicted ribonuclease YlaK